MTDLLQHLGMGFAVALTPVNLLYCLIGVVVGTAIGVLPGIGPVTTVAMLVPLTFGMSPTAALIMLAGIYYGSQYGGSTTAILINTPGETSSIMTCLALGLLLQRYGYPVAPIVLGLILGPMLETHFRRALIISRGDYGVFLQRPIAAGLLTVAAVYLLLPLLSWAWRRWRLVAAAAG